MKMNHKWGARSAGRGNVNKYRTRVAFRVRDCTSGAVQSATYSSRPDLEAAVARLRAARGVALGASASASGVAAPQGSRVLQGSRRAGLAVGQQPHPLRKGSRHPSSSPAPLPWRWRSPLAAPPVGPNLKVPVSEGITGMMGTVKPPAQPSPTPPPFCAHASTP
jgi:hypothetical protein